MIEKGFVKEIREDRVIVAVTPTTACFGCMNEECKKAGNVIEALNKDGLTLQYGEEVSVDIPASRTVLDAARVFAPPAAAFLAVYLLGSPLSWSDSLRASAAASALVVTGLCIYIWKKKHPPKTMPEIHNTPHPTSPARGEG
jgi:sigma-E factor negative regulatory protein RseC